MIKPTLIFLIGCVLLSGCARSTIETRKKEKYGAYQSMSPEFQAMANQGQIGIGMPRDGVFIAWGEPHETIISQGPGGTTETWVYISTRLESHSFWVYGSGYHHGRYGGHYGGHYAAPYLASSYYPVNYPSAEVFFEEAVVKSWRRLQTNIP